MTNKFKTLLKTTAAVATLMVGSQTWGAFWTSDDNTELTTTDLTISSTYAAVIPNGTLAAITPAHKITMTKDNTELLLVSAVGATVTPGAATVISATKGSSIYLIAPAAIVLTAATLLGPSSGKASLYIRGAAVTLPATIDPAKFDIVADYPGTKTLTVAGLLMPALKLSGGATTLATVTAVSGAISGDGNLILPAGLSSVSSDISKLTGTITTGAATTFATAPQRVSMLHGVTISGNGTVKKVTVGAAALTLTANEDITIEELDINSRALFNLSPASGKTITIKKLTWTVGSSSVVDVLGAGKVIVGGASGYDGNFTTSGGGTITVK